MNKRQEFVKALLPHAVAAIGRQHGWLVRWAIGKAAVECGWDLDNALIREAHNCLGIKAADGVPHVVFRANTGPETGEPTRWRKFDSLTACFAEFARMLNDRAPYHPFRNKALAEFERIYTGGLRGHAEAVLLRTHEVTAELEYAGLCDERGRIMKDQA